MLSMPGERGISMATVKPILTIEGTTFKVGDRVMVQSAEESEVYVPGLFGLTNQKIKHTALIGAAMEIIDILPQHVALYYPIIGHLDEFTREKPLMMLRTRFIQLNFRIMEEREYKYFFPEERR